MKAWLPFALLTFSLCAAAEDGAKVATPAAPVNTKVTYELRDLRPTGFTQYVGADETMRQYFDFQNDQGSYHIIYEEVANAAPARTMANLRQVAVAFDVRCSMDIECQSKAFCTADCKQMYYETANAPGDAIYPDRNKCKLLYLSCEKASAPLPAAAPAAGL